MQKTEASYSGVHLLITGPIRGTVTCEDGTTYDVTEPVIEVAEHHRQEVAHLIGDRYAAEGHPSHTDGAPFIHEREKSFQPPVADDATAGE